MKNTILTFIFLSFYAINAQNIKRIQVEKFHVIDIEHSNDLLNFRLWNQGQIIDFTIKSDSTKTVTIINFVKPVSCNKETLLGTPKYIIQNIELKPFEFQTAFNVIKKYKNVDISPTDPFSNEPDKWYRIEQKIDGIYKSIVYNDPENRKDILQIQNFLHFLSELDEKIGFSNYWNLFYVKLDAGCYMINGEKYMSQLVINY